MSWIMHKYRRDFVSNEKDESNSIFRRMRRLRKDNLFFVLLDCFRKFSPYLLLNISSLFESFTVCFNIFLILLTSFRAKTKFMEFLLVLQLKIASFSLFIKLFFKQICSFEGLISYLCDKSQ